MTWVPVHHPIEPEDHIPAERKAVLVWLSNKYMPFCGYIRHQSDGPFFVVYHGNTDIGADVVGWCDCLPEEAPEWVKTGGMYNRDQRTGRGQPERNA